MARKKMQTVKIKITLKGRDESDIMSALYHVIKSLKNGNVSGFDSNEDGSYNFNASQTLLID